MLKHFTSLHFTSTHLLKDVKISNSNNFDLLQNLHQTPDPPRPNRADRVVEQAAHVRDDAGENQGGGEKGKKPGDQLRRVKRYDMLVML